VRLKSFTTGAAVAAVAGGLAIGVAALPSGVPVAAAPAVRPVVFDLPLPQQPPPAAAVPTEPELTAILVGLANPAVPFSQKDYLIEGGVGIIEGKTADRLLRNAASKGYLPLTFGVTDIVPVGPNATATVTASGPQLAATTQSVTFVNQGGWKLSRASATSLLQSALASG